MKPQKAVTHDRGVSKYAHLYNERIAAPESPNASDRDRILYSVAFRRLAGVTQVADSAEGQVYHNRLTHSLRVARVARRLAEFIQRNQAEEATEAGGIDAEVAEAAGLAHDIGHPPFGHIGEAQLNLLARANGDPDGFEGNAQSFRIVTKLTHWDTGFLGLNLTRGTLNGILKYPWFRKTQGPRARKFGAYKEDSAEFKFARAGGPEGEGRSLEAQVMDYADEIAYSVHDLDDFYRAGMIPLEVLTTGRHNPVLRTFIERVDPKIRTFSDDPASAVNRLLAIMPLDAKYSGERKQQVQLRTLTSALETRFVQGVRLIRRDSNWIVEIGPDLKTELLILKELLWAYVIESQELSGQQYGKEQTIRFLFEAHLDALESGKWRTILPRSRREQLDQLQTASPGGGRGKIRLVCDYVSSLTDAEAHYMNRRLRGIDAGQVTDRVPL